MANQLTFSIDGQVTDTVLNQILDTISRYQITLDQPGDNIFRSNLVADNAAGANVAFPATLPLPALVLVVNRDATNDLLIGPAVAGPAIARFVQIPDRKSVV